MAQKVLVSFIACIIIITSVIGCSKRKEDNDDLPTTDSSSSAISSNEQSFCSTSDSETNSVVKKGDSVYFGYYGNEDIEWIILDQKDGKTLLLSKYIIDSKQYNEEDESITWEYSSVRKWLNNDFIKNAFDKNEQQKIQSTLISNNNNDEYGINGGNDTTDKVFLLSIDETYLYFPSEDERKTFGTMFAKDNGLYENKGYNEWWLRSPGHVENYATVVDSAYGMVHEYGSNISEHGAGVRPAIWVVLEQ